MFKISFFNKWFRNLLKFQLFFLIIFNHLSLTSKEQLSKEVFRSSESETNSIDKEILNPYKYILGPGDLIYIDFLGIPEFSQNYLISPDGFIYLPEIKSLYADGLTITQLIDQLEKAFSSVIISPKIGINIISHRPIRIYISGEINKPGFYTLNVSKINNPPETLTPPKISPNLPRTGDLNLFPENNKFISSEGMRGYVFPTLYDVIATSKGITPYSDLENISIIRKNGSSKIKANVNLIPLITEGDMSQNIRIFDGDSIRIPKSNKDIKDQIIAARKSNINPSQIVVYVTGNVENPGAIILPQGSSLNQAIAMAGGRKILSGKIEFLRFDDYDKPDKRYFTFNKSSNQNSFKNPFLIDGDIIHVQKSVVGIASSALGVISNPILNTYTLLNIF